MNRNHTKSIASAAVVAALYAALTVLSEPISYGILQIRIAEALCVLPYFSSVMIAGVTAGCLIANLFSPMMILDVIFGTLATFLGAVGTRLIARTKLWWLAPLPPVVCNTLIVGTMLTVTEGTADMFLLNILSVFAGEAIACYGLGLPLLLLVKKKKLL